MSAALHVTKTFTHLVSEAKCHAEGKTMSRASAKKEFGTRAEMQTLQGRNSN